MDLAEFRSYTLPQELVEDLCRANGLPRLRSFERVPKGEVSAAFDLSFVDGSAAVLKVFCRSGGDPAPLLREEASLQYLRHHSDAPVPRWSLLVRHAEIPYPCILRHRLGGVDADDLWPRLPRVRQRLLLRRIGATLAEIHGATLERANELLDAGVYSADMWPHRSETAFRAAMDSLHRQAWMDPVLLHRLEEAWDEGQEALHAPFRPVLLHRDYQLWNLRVDPLTLEVVGVLDLDETALGPACSDVRDLELNHFLHHPWMRREFWIGYGADPPAGLEARRMRMSAIVRAVSLLAAYWGPTANIAPASLWHLLCPWCDDVEDLRPRY